MKILKEIIFVDVKRNIYHMQLYIHMLKLNIMEYFLKEQQLYIKRDKEDQKKMNGVP